MGWLRLVGSLKLEVSFAEYRLFYRALLQKWPVISRSLLIVATPYCNLTSHSFFHHIRSSITYQCHLNSFILASYDSVSHIKFILPLYTAVIWHLIYSSIICCITPISYHIHSSIIFQWRVQQEWLRFESTPVTHAHAHTPGTVGSLLAPVYHTGVWMWWKNEYDMRLQCHMKEERMWYQMGVIHRHMMQECLCSDMSAIQWHMMQE